MGELPRHIDEFPKEEKENVLFNLGGVINHNLYFSSMSPNKEKPNNILLSKISNTFGSFDEFKKEFKQSALSIKGSGYTFLVLDNKKLKIIHLLNQDNPYNYCYATLLALDM